MVIKSLELSNFRNYSLLNLSFDRGTNILYGDNAQGKTNILEAIYLCATTKSHKGAKDKDIVNFNEEEAHIRAYLEKKEDEIRIDMHLRKNKSKGIAIDGTRIKKAAELLGIMNVVFFSPEDLSIIGYNNSMLVNCCDPELTSIDNKLETLCQHLITTLMGVLGGSEMPKKTVFSGELVKRGTTK